MPLVSICCQTYDHRDYIKQTIDSFLMQRTNFKFEILLRDDASTDGTTEIVREYAANYPNLIKPLIYSENQFQKGVKPLVDNLKRAKGKYVAICEGDDYWTDPYKLQKQVDFLESHADYGMVYTKYKRLNEETGEISETFLNRKLPEGDIYSEYLTGSFIGTLTTMLRTELVLEYIKRFETNTLKWVMGDRPLFLYVTSKSKAGFINEYTAVYRRNNGSVSSFSSIYKQIEFFNKSYEIRTYFINNVRDVTQDVKIKINKTYYKEMLKYYDIANEPVKCKEMFMNLKNLNGTTFKDFLIYRHCQNKINRIIIEAYWKVLEQKRKFSKQIKKIFN